MITVAVDKQNQRSPNFLSIWKKFILPLPGALKAKQTHKQLRNKFINNKMILEKM